MLSVQKKTKFLYISSIRVQNYLTSNHIEIDKTIAMLPERVIVISTQVRHIIKLHLEDYLKYPFATVTKSQHSSPFVAIPRLSLVSDEIATFTVTFSKIPC